MKTIEKEIEDFIKNEGVDPTLNELRLCVAHAKQTLKDAAEKVKEVLDCLISL